MMLTAIITIPFLCACLFHTLNFMKFIIGIEFEAEISFWVGRGSFVCSTKLLASSCWCGASQI